MSSVYGNSDNVIVGSAILRVAPLGTELPDLTVYPVVWPSGWDKVGFTESGVEWSSSASTKPIKVDEQPNPIDRVVDEEDATVTAQLAEATLANMNRALSTGTLGSVIPAGASNVSSQKFSFGGGTLKYFMVGLEGPSPNDALTRVFLGYKALPQGKVTMSHKRTEKTILNIELGLIADTTRDDGDNVYSALDIIEDHTT